MKKFLKILGIILGVVVLLLLGFAAYINFGPRPAFEEVEIKEINVEPTEARIERGAKLVTTICAICHVGTNGALEGRHLMDAPPAFGKIYATNITQHPQFGIGEWSDGELYRLLRTGVRKDGHIAYPPMMATATIADEDIYSIIAYLKSDAARVQPSANNVPEAEPSFLLKMISKVGFKPYAYPEGPLEIPDSSDVLAFGEYLANGPYFCFYCHSASFETNDHFNPENSPGFYGGGNMMLSPDGSEVILTANITPHPTAGIGNWSEEAFIKAVTAGVRPDGAPVRAPMPKFTALDSFELHAIWEYMKTVPPLANEVERNVEMEE